MCPRSRLALFSTVLALCLGGAFALAAERFAPSELPALHVAALHGDAALVSALLDAGVDVQSRDARGRTPLHLAATSNNGKLVTELALRGADVNAVDLNGDTPLHAAARRGQLATVRALVEAGADVNARNLQGQTPLHVLGAAARPDVDEVAQLVDEIAAYLIASGADADATDDTGTAAWPRPDLAPHEFEQPSGYPTYDQIVAQLQNRAATYSNIARVFNIGPSSMAGKSLWAIKITSNPDVEADKPEHKYISTMHGDEVVGVVMCLNLIDYLLTGYGTDPRATALVDGVEIWIVPCMNPYGYTNNTRTNAAGADLNRSFPEWMNGEANSPTGRPTEVQTIMNWSAAHSFILSANFHGGALVVNYPYDNDGKGSTFSPSPDEDMFVYISEQYSVHNPPMWNSTSFTHGITNGAAWYEVVGGMQDWDYRYMGGNEVTIELGETKGPAYSQMPTYWNNNRDSMLSYMETIHLGVRGIVTAEDTGLPLLATVAVVGRDHNSYTDPDVGDYHRMLLPGSYQLTYKATGYDTVTKPATVVQGTTTRVDVALPRPAHLLVPNGGESLYQNRPTTVTWTGSTAAQFQVQSTANYGSISTVSEGFEGTALPADFTTGGNLPWITTTAAHHAGLRAARAGAIGNSQQSWMKRTVTGGTVSFWYKVSSENTYDWFDFYVDADRKIHASGTSMTTFQQYSITLPPGNYELKWVYTKDGSQIGGSDTVWVDDVVVQVDNTVWTDIGSLTPAGATSATWTPTQLGTASKIRVRATYGAGSYGQWDESDAMFSVVEAPAGCPGDVNCDGVVDFADIDPFVEALGYSGGVGWPHPDCPWINADANNDGNVDFADIDPFVGLIGNVCP